MMQDINRNGKFDTTWIGLPEEPFGFSNNADPGLSEPSFKRTPFPVVAGGTTITIHLSDTDEYRAGASPSAQRASRSQCESRRGKVGASISKRLPHDPRLETERLILRGHTAEDFDPLAGSSPIPKSRVLSRRGR